MSINLKRQRSILNVLIVILLTTLTIPALAQGIEKPPLKIVHLGDSYSAGNGFYPNSQGKPVTKTGV